MGTILRRLQRVPWAELQVPRGSAKEIPALLAKAAWGDRESAGLALDDLGDHICELGFVVSEATVPAVPFLLELAGAPQVTCKAEVLALLLNICTAEQWSAAAAAAGPKYARGYAPMVRWETEAHSAVLAGRRLIEGLVDSVDPDVVAAAERLVRAIAVVEERRSATEPGTRRPPRS
jgi:hypothetical protein